MQKISKLLQVKTSNHQIFTNNFQSSNCLQSIEKTFFYLRPIELQMQSTKILLYSHSLHNRPALDIQFQKPVQLWQQKFHLVSYKKWSKALKGICRRYEFEPGTQVLRPALRFQTNVFHEDRFFSIFHASFLASSFRSNRCQ